MQNNMDDIHNTKNQPTGPRTHIQKGDILRLTAAPGKASLV